MLAVRKIKWKDLCPTPLPHSLWLGLVLPFAICLATAVISILFVRFVQLPKMQDPLLQTDLKRGCLRLGVLYVVIGLAWIFMIAAIASGEAALDYCFVVFKCLQLIVAVVLLDAVRKNCYSPKMNPN